MVKKFTTNEKYDKRWYLMKKKYRKHNINS